MIDGEVQPHQEGHPHPNNHFVEVDTTEVNQRRQTILKAEPGSLAQEQMFVPESGSGAEEELDARDVVQYKVDRQTPLSLFGATLVSLAPDLL